VTAAPCPTCRHEVQHLHKLAELIARFGRAAQAHPRLHVVLDRHKTAHEKAEARHADHLYREHDGPCPDCRRYVIRALTAGPNLTDDERRAAIREAADHLVKHIEEARAA
jgi:hypothetical protein